MFLTISLVLLSTPILLPYLIFVMTAANNMVKGNAPEGLIETSLMVIYITAAVYLPWCAVTSQNIGASFLYYCPIVASILIICTYMNKDKGEHKSEIRYK